MMLDSPSTTPRGLLNRLHLDLPLLMGLMVLAGVSLVVLYSAGNQSTELVMKQSVRFAIGFGVLFVMAQIPSDTLKRWAPWLFIVGMGLLIAVLGLGIVGKGAQRWLGLGPIRFQPSELMKIIVPMMVAWYLADVALPPRLRRVFWGLLLVLVPALLVAKQPDLGTALFITCAGVFVLLFSGVRWRLIGYATLLTIPFTVWMWFYGMHDYQRKRVLTFLNPESDPLGAGYHVIQSKIAIGSGGIYGKGWLRGTQSHLEFLPERHTDFVFAVFGEEFGLAAVLMLLAVYLFVIMRGLYIAATAQDTFSRLLAGSLTMTLFVYVFVNIGMVIGLLPVVGLPLPMISYGGSSLVTIMASFGILMSIHTHRKLIKS